MRKVGMMLPLFMAATVAFGAEAKVAETKPAEPKKTAEVKPADAKKAEPKKDEAKVADAKKTEAKKVEVKKEPPIVPAFPWIVPAKAVELTQDAKYDVRPEGLRTTVELKAGERISFLLEENLKDTVWIVSALDTRVATINRIGAEKGGCFSNPTVTYEIVAVHPGRTLLEMSMVNNRNTPMRAFRCYIEVK